MRIPESLQNLSSLDLNNVVVIILHVCLGYEVPIIFVIHLHVIHNLLYKYKLPSLSLSNELKTSN